MATLGLAGTGYGIRYEFGIFFQEIKEGRQVEHPDEWLRYGNPWEIARPEDVVPVQFAGRVDEYLENGKFRARWVPAQSLMGVPFDTPIAGYGNGVVNTLRLWRERASMEFDLAVFNDGDYRKAVEEKSMSESISKVLYPNDHSQEGKILRLKQQYFFVACSIHDIVLKYKRTHASFDAFASYFAASPSRMNAWPAS
jgi:starch phosphorylase